MYFQRAAILLTILFLTFIQVKAQEKFGLSECLVFTLNSSPRLKAEGIAQEKETATLLQQKSAFLPQIDAFVNYHNFFNDFPTYLFPQAEGSVLAGEALTGPYPVPLGLRHNLNTGLTINQTIFDMRFFGTGSLMEHYRVYNDLKLSLAEEDVMYQVANLFYQIVINKEKLKFLDLNLERLVKLQDILKLQVNQGFARQTDLDKLLVKTSNLRSNREKLQSGIQQQMRYLKRAMGMSQDVDLEIEHDETVMPVLDLDNIEQGNHPEQRILEEQKTLNALNAQKLNADYYPKLQAYAALLFQAQRQQLNFLADNQDWYNVHQWGLKLAIPIMRGFEKKRKKEISEIVDAQLSFGLEQQIEQNDIEFRNAVSALEVARIEQQAQQENTALAERMYRQSALSYEQGTMLLMDFLDSEATLREAKMIHATAILDTRLAELKILKASGKLKELVNQ